MLRIKQRIILVFLLFAIIVFSACEKKVEPRHWKLFSAPLTSWNKVHESEHKRDSIASSWNGTHWETTFNVALDSVSGELFFYAPDTLDFELLLNNKVLIYTNAQGAIWPGVVESNDIPIYSWSKQLRPFKIDPILWMKFQKQGENKLLLKIRSAPRDSEFASQTGIYVMAGDMDQNAMLLQYPKYENGVLPCMVIEVNETLLKQKEKGQAKMKLQCNGTSLDCGEMEREIEMGIRGFSSAQFPKKQFSIRMSGDTLKKEKVSLLGMNASSKWILQGPYSDPSLIRNALSYEIWRSMGYHAPQSRYVEVVINGLYQGVYLLMERNELSPGRLDLNTRSEGSDAFLVQINRPDKMDVVVFAGSTAFIVDDPPGIEMDSLYLKQIQLTLEKFVAKCEAPDVHDQEIDWNSWADYYILQELSKNPDAYMVSTFLHRGNTSEGAKLKAGPVWDFDIAYGGTQIMSCDHTDAFVAEVSGQANALFKHLFQKESFRNLVNERYLLWRQNVLSDAQLNHLVDSLSTLVDEPARQRNFTRFPVFGLNKFLTHPAPIKDYAEELSNLRSWLQNRCHWLDTHFKPDHTVGNHSNAESVQ